MKPKKYQVEDYHEFSDIMERLSKKYPKIKFHECGLYSKTGVPGKYVAIFYTKKSEAKELIKNWTNKCQEWEEQING